jgi:hypothetical protein
MQREVRPIYLVRNIESGNSVDSIGRFVFLRPCFRFFIWNTKIV